MRPLYILFFVLGLLFGSYMVVNDFNFDNISFSNYLINMLFILLLSCVVLIAGVAWLVSLRRKHHDKGMMTIRQYYEYKSAR